MTEEEPIFIMSGEVSICKEAQKKDAHGFIENKEAAKEGGTAAGEALEAYEKRTGNRVVSHQNFKQQIETKNEEKPTYCA